MASRLLVPICLLATSVLAYPPRVERVEDPPATLPQPIQTAPPATAPSAASPPLDSHVLALPLPGAPPDGMSLDFLALDRGRHRVWVPAGGTGSVDVIDTKTKDIRRIEGFPTAEVERRGKKRMVGPSSAILGDGFVYVGNRADSSLCAVDAS